MAPDLQGKLAVALAVLGGVIWLQDSGSPRPDCRQEKLDVHRQVVDKAVFVDLRYLDMLIGNHRAVAFDDLLKWMLEEQFETVEVQTRPDFVPYDLTLEKPSKPFLRLRLHSFPSPACQAFEGWVHTSPALRFPGLRRAGLLADVCVAVDGVDQPQSRHRVTVQEISTRKFSSGWQSQFQVDLLDVLAPKAEPAAALRVHFGFGGGGSGGFRFALSCKEGAEERVRGFKAALRSGGTPLLRKPDTVPLPDAQAVSNETSTARLRRWQWVVKPGAKWEFQLVSPDGLAWVEPRYAVHRSPDGKSGTAILQRHALHVLDGQELLEIPLAWKDHRA